MLLMWLKNGQIKTTSTLSISCFTTFSMPSTKLSSEVLCLVMFSYPGWRLDELLSSLLTWYVVPGKHACLCCEIVNRNFETAFSGIIDPNANYRLPTQVAFDRGLFDQKLNKILEDPSDDTRGFFDPNTHENLTYLELMQRSVDITRRARNWRKWCYSKL